MPLLLLVDRGRVVTHEPFGGGEGGRGEGGGRGGRKRGREVTKKCKHFIVYTLFMGIENTL